MKLLPSAVESITFENAESFELDTLVSLIFDVHDKFDFGNYRDQFDEILTNYLFGFCAYIALDYAEAIKIFAQVPNDCELFPYVKYNAAECYFKQKDISNAGKMLQFVNRNESTYFNAQLRIAKQLDELNKKEEVAQRLENLLKEKDIPHLALTDIVKYCIETNKFKDAGEFLKKYKDESLEKMLLRQQIKNKYFTINPVAFPMFFNQEIYTVTLRDVYEICRVFRMDKETVEKIVDIRIDKSKSSDETDLWKAMKMYISQDYNGALKSLQGISNKFYSIESIYCLVAFCYSQQDRKQDAYDLLAQLPEAIQDYEIILYQMFELAISIGNMEEVNKLIKRFEQSSAYYNVANYNMAKFQMDHKMFALAKNRLALVEPDSSVYVRAQLLLESELYEDYEVDPEIEQEMLPKEINILTVFKNEYDEKDEIKQYFKCHLNRFDKNYKRKLSKKHSIF